MPNEDKFCFYSIFSTLIQRGTHIKVSGVYWLYQTRPSLNEREDKHSLHQLKLRFIYMYMYSCTGSKALYE